MNSLPVEAVLPAIIGAIATITAALIQLALGWRKEMRSREGHTPAITQRTRRGMVFAVFVLMVASAVGGFSLSQYLVGLGSKEAQERDRETRAQIEQLSAIAARLERSANRNSQPAEAPATAPASSPLPPATCLEGNPPVEKPCAETGGARSGTGQSAAAPTTPVSSPSR